MYFIETSKDGESFKSLFVSGRLRLYATLSNARNGAKQLLKNPNNQYKVVRIINRESPQDQSVYIRLGDKGYEEDIVPSSTSSNVAESSTNKIPLDSLIENTPSKQVPKDSRIQSLKKAHDKWKMKKMNPPEIKRGNSLNNLSDNNSVKQINDVYAGLMENMLEEAIRQNNPKKLFRLEVMLSQGGYSWYYDNSIIHVDTTDNVVQKLKDIDLVLD